MKTIKHIALLPGIIIATFFLSLNLFAQVEAVTIPDEAERNYSRTFHNYDDTQQKTELIEQRWLDSGAWGNHRRKQYRYEDDGRTVVTLIQFWQNGRWNNATREVATYNADNDRTSRTREHWDGDGEWTPEQRDIYTYENTNQMSEWRSQLRTEAGNWFYNWRFTYSYTDDDLISGIMYEEWRQNSWQPVRQTTDSYNENNQRTERIIYESHRGRRTPEKAYVFEYDDESGLMIRQLTRRWDGNDWRNYEDELYDYDEESRLIQTEYRTFEENDTGRVVAREVYNYGDEEESKTERIREERSPDGSMEEVWRYVYIYDYRGYKTVKSFYVFQEDGWIEQNRTTFTYDIYGNCTSSVTQK